MQDKHIYAKIILNFYLEFFRNIAAVSASAQGRKGV